MTEAIKKIYFIGIKGTGMSALALVAQGMGYQVAGSDTAETFITDASLEAAGITPLVDFSANHITADIDLVVVGAAYGEDNPEVQTARLLGLPLWPSSQLMGFLAGQRQTIAIAGTHGKTTTTALLSYLLYQAGWQPSFVIGTGQVAGLPSHGMAGAGQHFVVEADDYKRSQSDNRPKFLDLSPTVAVITSIEHDHPDLYPSLEDCVQAFYQFAQRLKPGGLLLLYGDDPTVTGLRARLPAQRTLTYGVSAGLDYTIVPTAGQPGSFSLVYSGQTLGPFQLTLQGQHNLLNATAALAVAMQLGLKPEQLQPILATFRAVERRYQLVGQVGEKTIIDDYAHHPTAVRLTLQAARAQYPDRPIWCFFQSHTYSRTKALLAEFGQAFGDADTVVVTDIFASAREKEVTIETADLVEEIKKHHPHVVYVPQAQLLASMREQTPANAVIITMGAGDIYKVGHQLVAGQP